MLASIRALLTGIVDYAGTFPPAALSLTETITQYVEAARSPHGWLLGRLVVPAGALRQFDREVVPGERECNVSIVLGVHPAAHLDEAIAYAARPNPAYRITALEFPPLNASEIRDLSRQVPPEIESFFEVPIDTHLESHVQAIAASGALAKVRTGGVAPGAFPTPEGLGRFVEACLDAGVAFKATAGLHHALRGCYPLTYEPGSPTETMYGFLNVAVAAAVLHGGADMASAVDALRLESFDFRDEGLVYKGRVFRSEELADARRRLFRSFGSCSVREPIDELARLHLL